MARSRVANEELNNRNLGNETALNQADSPPPARRSWEGAGEGRGL